MDLNAVDRKLKWPFPPTFFLGIAVSFAAILVLLQVLFGLPRVSAAIGIWGAFMACCGVVTIGRPIIRAGGYLAWHEASKVVGGASYVPTPEEVVEEQENRKDAYAVNLIGPALVIVGTLVNGIAGFF